MTGFSFPINARKYDTWEITADFKTGAEYLCVLKPDGTKQNVNFFYHTPAKFVYDIHGYETVENTATQCLMARFCPEEAGEYAFEILKNNEIIGKGEFVCLDSSNHGYIRVSNKDKRYFEYTDGTPFIPVGINMVFPTSFSRSDGSEFGTTNVTDTLGMKCYEKWIKEFAEAGGNFLRIWLGHEYFTTDTEVAGVIRYEQFAKTDYIITLAKKYGIKLKFTLEQFRRVADKRFWHFTKKIRTAEGRVCQSGHEWLTDDVWQNAWKKRVMAYLDRYANEPTVAVWELWNEMLCFDSSTEDIVNWTKATTKFIKKYAPNQLVTTSFGSFNPRSGYEWSKAHLLEELDYLQIHRYLDQGESLEIRRKDPYTNVIDAIECISTPDKPAVLAETGAVNDNHSGPFRYYLWDNRGILFADMVYTPFFAGSAGCGQIWHWDERYITSKNLYGMFKPFADLVEGINPQKEDFSSVDLSNDEAFCTVLKGNQTIVGYIRNKQDSWYNTLRDMNEPEIIGEISLPLEDVDGMKCEVIKIWNDDTSTLENKDGNLSFKNLKYGCFFKLSK